VCKCKRGTLGVAEEDRDSDTADKNRTCSESTEKHTQVLHRNKRCGALKKKKRWRRLTLIK